MRDLGKIVLYLLATVLLAALIAPPLFWAGKWIIAHGWLTSLEGTPFQRYFNRAVMIAAVALLWPLARWLGMRNIGAQTMQRDPRRWQHLGGGFAAALFIMACLGALLIALEIYRFRQIPSAAQFFKIASSAAGASLAEELLFRGALLGIFLRSLPRWWALFLTSALFSIVHFLKPREDAVPDHAVDWLSGFVLVPQAFWQFTEPVLLLAGFATLFVLGWVLGYAALRTRSLWLPIGLHAGLVMGKSTFSKMTKRLEEALPWFGSEIQIGVGPLVALVLLGIIVWISIKNEPRPIFASRG